MTCRFNFKFYVHFLLADDIETLEYDKTLLEVANITPEWIVSKEGSVHEAMVNIQSGVQRLRHLCGILFNMHAKAKRKKPIGKHLTSLNCVVFYFMSFLFLNVFHYSFISLVFHKLVCTLWNLIRHAR